jgi:DNA-binding transcriptional MerR regulator
MPANYRIGEFAELSGVSAKTLRFYDEIGLFRPAGIDPRTRYRHYLPRQLEDLASILALKNLGVPLHQIRVSLARPASAHERRALLTHLKATVEDSIHSASQSLAWIDAALAELDRAPRPISIVVKHRPAMPIASFRTTIDTYAEVVEIEHQLLRALPAHCVADTRGVLWHRCADSGSLEAEPFFVLKQPAPPHRAYHLKQLPPATLACIYSDSDDASAEQAYAALRRWTDARGYRLAGPKRELYLDPLLEVQFPIQSS